MSWAVTPTSDDAYQRRVILAMSCTAIFNQTSIYVSTREMIYPTKGTQTCILTKHIYCCYPQPQTLICPPPLLTSL